MKRFFLLTIVAAALCSGLMMAAEKNPVIVMETSKGTIKIELFADKAPITANNFVAYANAKHFDGTIFHRVMKDFMIQGGGYTHGMREKDTNRPIKNESFNGLENKRGTIAMARTGDPDSATSQFFINHKDNPGLDKERCPDRVGYCVFGKVIEGMDVVDKIADVNVRVAPGVDHVPNDDVIIKSVRVEK